MSKLDLSQYLRLRRFYDAHVLCGLDHSVSINTQQYCTFDIDIWLKIKRVTVYVTTWLAFSSICT